MASLPCLLSEGFCHRTGSDLFLILIVVLLSFLESELKVSVNRIHEKYRLKIHSCYVGTINHDDATVLILLFFSFCFCLLY